MREIALTIKIMKKVLPFFYLLIRTRGVLIVKIIGNLTRHAIQMLASSYGRHCDCMHDASEQTACS